MTIFESIKSNSYYLIEPLLICYSEIIQKCTTLLLIFLCFNMFNISIEIYNTICFQLIFEILSDFIIFNETDFKQCVHRREGDVDWVYHSRGTLRKIYRQFIDM